MSVSPDQPDRSTEDPDEQAPPGSEPSGVGEQPQATDPPSGGGAEAEDPDAGPTATAEQVEQDSERDQAEG